MSTACWLTVKEAALLLGTLVQTAPLTGALAACMQLLTDVLSSLCEGKLSALQQKVMVAGNRRQQQNQKVTSRTLQAAGVAGSVMPF